jgi:hypothetical protein
MNPEHQNIAQNPFLPFPPEKFAAQFDEKSKLKKILDRNEENFFVPFHVLKSVHEKETDTEID